MSLQLYNSMTRAVAPVPENEGKRLSLYVCGPTIYNYGHIGNFRTYVAVDLLRRALKHFGYKVDHVMQFTDVDDKTIRGSREKNLPLKEFTAIFRKAFLEDAKTLNIEMAERTPDATDFIPDMVTLIGQLIEKKAAYVSDDGSVYFRIASFPKYGCLCHLDMANLISGARVNQDEYEKEGVGDFVLWKKWVAADGDVGWDSPWGKGRPGWHIECSALSMKHLGNTIDIHGGGTDLRFPHHENEIAQSEAATGLTFVRHWFHVEHLLVDGQKMSKSLGNMYTVRDVIERGYTGRELRYALFSGANYAKNLNFTWQGMDDARTALQRIDEWRKRIETTKHIGKAKDSDFDRLLNTRFATPAQSEEVPLASFIPLENSTLASATKFLQQIDNALARDLNINDALGHLFQLIRETNKAMDSNQLSYSQAGELDAAWKVLDAVLGLGDPIVSIPAEVQALLDQRTAARKGKDFAKSDELRKAIESLGWKVKDTAKGQELLPG
jgi:cysteinyl-tRNA synthetase